MYNSLCAQIYGSFLHFSLELCISKCRLFFLIHINLTKLNWQVALNLLNQSSTLGRPETSEKDSCHVQLSAVFADMLNVAR